MEEAGLGIHIEVEALFADLAGGSFGVLLTAVDGVVGVVALRAVLAEVV